jgi:beta-glucanase (GH16 family)
MIKDKLINKFLNLRASAITAVLPRYYGNDEPDTTSMEMLLDEDFTAFNESRWRIGQPWGVMHPGSTYQYYDVKSVRTTEFGLILDHRYAPEYKSHYSLESPVLSPYSVGLVTSRDFYRYGFFKFKISLPHGVGLWPAIWLTSIDTWPPEIDILEAYTNEIGLYNGRFETNLHYKIYPDNSDAGAQKHPLTQNDATVSCWWTKHFIRFYYNGLLVRQITDKQVLEWFENQRMMIVLNNAIRPEFVDLQLQIPNIPLSKFIVYSAKVWQ